MRAVGATLLGLTLATLAHAQTEIDWVTIGAVGNRGWDGTEFITGTVVGRGSVGYEYRIGRTEVTTAQWMEYINTFTARADAPPVVGAPLTWGAVVDPTYSGPGVRYRLSTSRPNAAMVPVGGLSWRDAARFCNWLHNEKSTDLSAIADGAYDTTTFGTDSNGQFTDQQAHHAAARFWIPTHDEWLKAAHYDPVLDRWWDYNNGTDTMPIPGVPGVGEANHGFTLGGFAERYIPLASYPDTQSPWGLLDVAGGTLEWTESTFESGAPGTFLRRRSMGSSYAGDVRGAFGGAFTILSPEPLISVTGLRVASSIPAPASVYALLALLFATGTNRRRCN